MNNLIFYTHTINNMFFGRIIVVLVILIIVSLFILDLVQEKSVALTIKDSLNMEDLPTPIKDIDKEIEKAKRNLNITKKF